MVTDRLTLPRIGFFCGVQVGAWPRRWREVCGAIRVPVQYAPAEYDAPWHVSEALIGEFAQALERALAGIHE